MTALAQGSAGVALVMCFALLHAGQISTAAVMLAIQSGAIAVSLVVLHQPLMAIPPLILAAGFWLLQRQIPIFHPHTQPLGGAKLSIGVGAVLAILAQSQGGLALPATVVILSILLAATRSHPLMQLAALAATQNGLSLAGGLVAQPALLSSSSITAASLATALLLPMTCLLLPLPLAAGLLAPAIASSPNHRAHVMVGLTGWAPKLTSWLAAFWRANPAIPGTVTRLGWVDVALSLGIFAATLFVPLDSLASIFAPLLGIDGVMRSCARRNRRALTAARRGSALLQSGLTVLAVCAPNLIVAWLAVVGAMAMALLPAMSRRWGGAVVAFLGAGLGLFGIQLLPAAPTLLAYFSLFAGFVTVAALVPDLAVVLVILILRLGNQGPWPSDVEALGIAIATMALLSCAILLISRNGSQCITLLVLSQASIAALTICVGQDDSRFAALVLLILLTLSRAAARVPVGPVATLAVAGLGGIPPLGVFPGLVLVALTITAHNPWLLLPIGVALIPVVSASVPRRLPDFSIARKLPSVGWLPLLLALAVGYLAPSGLVQWWRILTAAGT
jgi:hypothetical protein